MPDSTGSRWIVGQKPRQLGYARLQQLWEAWPWKKMLILKLGAENEMSAAAAGFAP